MNVTEKQKQILVNFMQSHPDFGRDRLRYNRVNKRKIVSDFISCVLLNKALFLQTLNNLLFKL